MIALLAIGELRFDLPIPPYSILRSFKGNFDPPNPP